MKYFLGFFRACQEIVNTLDFTMKEFQRASNGLTKPKQTPGPKSIL
jgi:hypothetical protein